MVSVVCPQLASLIYDQVHTLFLRNANNNYDVIVSIHYLSTTPYQLLSVSSYIQARLGSLAGRRNYWKPEQGYTSR